MAGLEVTIHEPDDHGVIAGFERFTDELRAQLSPKIRDLTDQLLSRVHAAEPGPETGSLAEATESFFNETADGVFGGVEIGPEHGEPHNIKAGALEYGAHRRSAVSGYTRTVDQIFGEAIAPREEVVGPYSRRPNIEEFRFLRGALDGMQEQLSAAIEAAVSDAAKNFNE